MIDQLKEFGAKVSKLKKEHPELKMTFDEYYVMALDEIDSGESPSNEIEIAISEMYAAIAEYEETKIKSNVH